MKISHKILEVIAENSLSLPLVKSYLRITDDYHDKLVATFIQAAVEFAEASTGLSVGLRKIEATISKISSLVRLPELPIQDIEEVVIYPNSPKERILTKDDYFFNDIKLLIYNETNIGHDTKIIYTAGYKLIPALLADAMLTHIADMYDNRAGEGDVPLKSLNIYRYYRKDWRII